MTDASRTNDSEAIAKPDGAEKTDTEKPKSDGGAQANAEPKAAGEKKERDAEKKPRINEEVKSVLLFSATSVAAGYIGFLLTPAKSLDVSAWSAIPTTNLLLVLGTMIAVFFGTQTLIQKLLGKKDMKWILGNGGAIYLFLWFVNWIIFYNAM